MAKKQTSKNYGYVVLERTFSYDDSWYSPEEGGTALKVFADKAAAKAEAERRTIQWLKDTNLSTFYEEISNASSKYSEDDLVVAFDKIVGRKTGPIKETNGNYSYTIEVGESEYFSFPEGLTDDQYKRLAKLFDQVEPYFVQKVEMA